MDWGSEVLLVLALVLPWLVIIAILILKQRVKPSKKASIAGIIIAIALLTIYFIWNLFLRQ